MMKEFYAYRIVDVSEHGQYRSLFHGIGSTRSRSLETGVWMKAEPREVTNPGGGHQAKFLSGFHVLLDYWAAEDYLAKFKPGKRKRNLRIVACFVRGNVRRKPRARAEVYLADEQFVPHNGSLT